MRVSCLKIKPRVLIFPCESSRVSAAFTHATMGSLSPFFRRETRLYMITSYHAEKLWNVIVKNYIEYLSKVVDNNLSIYYIIYNR